MNSFTVARYESDIPSQLGEELAGIFERNYPVSHSEEERVSDLAMHAGAAAIQILLHQGRTFYVVSGQTSGTIQTAGFLEARTVEQEDGVYEQLSWIITDKNFRGLGLASLLHTSFIHDAHERSVGRLPKRSAALLSVHEQNPAVDVYRRWGYKSLGPRTTQKIFMIKDLPLLS